MEGVKALPFIMLKRIINMAKYIAKRGFSYFHPGKAVTIQVKEGGSVDIPEGDIDAYVAEGKIEKVRETASKAEPKVEAKKEVPVKAKATTKTVTKKAAPKKATKK